MTEKARGLWYDKDMNLEMHWWFMWGGGWTLLGAVMGSFAACQVRRMRRMEEGKKSLGGRSVCLHCKKRLKWWENLPVISWIMLQGKCRGCGARIGWMEILSEVGLAIVFGLMGLWYLGVGRSGVGILDMPKRFFEQGKWELINVDVVMFGVLMMALVGLWILLLYDALWQRLPSKVLTFVNACAIIYVILKQWSLFLVVNKSEVWGVMMKDLGQSLIGVGILAGTYFLLYKLSKEKLVGSGDWLVGLSVAGFLGSWWLALVEMFVANGLAVLMMWPKIKIKGAETRVALGPFLVAGFIIVWLMQETVKVWSYL